MALNFEKKKIAMIDLRNSLQRENNAHSEMFNDVRTVQLLGTYFEVFSSAEFEACYRKRET